MSHYSPDWQPLFRMRVGLPDLPPVLVGRCLDKAKQNN
jgi:hypothetical protein